MKKFTAHLNRETYTADYTVIAEDKEEAIKKISTICHERIAKVTEVKE